MDILTLKAIVNKPHYENFDIIFTKNIKNCQQN